jgi:hypothetical protein
MTEDTGRALKNMDKYSFPTSKDATMSENECQEMILIDRTQYRMECLLELSERPAGERANKCASCLSVTVTTQCEGRVKSSQGKLCCLLVAGRNRRMIDTSLSLSRCCEWIHS